MSGAVLEKGRCPLCGLPSLIEVDEADLPAVAAWLDGRGPVQMLLPHWSAGKREQLINGSHDECFDQAFGG